MKVNSKEDFVKFVRSLIAELEDGKKWENFNLKNFLEAMAYWTEDSDGFYKNQGRTIPIEPDWQVFSDILRASTMYE